MRHSHALSRALTLLSAVVMLAVGLAVTLPTRSPSAAAATTSGGAPGYWLVGNNGEVFQAGAPFYGDLRGVRLAEPIVGGATTPDGLGYWLVGSDGGIFAFGDARFHGSTGGIRLNQPIVAMAADPATGGYWLVASDGGVFAFGAPFFGSTGGIRLDKPVVGITPTPTGRGYWLVASDGGVFAFGDARFYGSTGNVRLAKPVVGMASNSDGTGYWMVASDGGIFAFGHVGFYGSTGGVRLASPVIGMSATASGNGYWLAASDGGVFTFGDAPFLGTSNTNGTPPIVAFMSTNAGYPFPPGSTGYDVSKYQCPPYGSLPSARTFAMVEIAGNINNYFNPCYQTEASWAGPNMSPYIFMNPLPSPAPKEAMTGPAGNCAASDTGCQSYNFGFYWAAYWVKYSLNLGIRSTLWWLDVEPNGGWATTAAAQQTNSQVISGAVAGLRASGVSAGIYSTNYQWSEITGNDVSFPGMALWVAGAWNLDTGTSLDPSAKQVCGLSAEPVSNSNPYSFYAPFAGGKTVVVQYDYSDPNRSIDPDYACP